MPRSPNVHGYFEDTIWSTILKAKGGEDNLRQTSLERLLTRYRQPILRHIQACQNCSPQQAEDLTQEFIHQCLRRDFLKQVSPEHGRFRSFIKACIHNFLRDQHALGAAGKRGGGRLPLSLDETDAEGNPVLEPAGPTVFLVRSLDREWALSVLAHALDHLDRECAAAGRTALFLALKDHLDHVPPAGAAAQIAARLGLTEGALYTAMNRLRARLGELLREEVRQTVGTQVDWREELKYLIELVGQ